MGIFQSSSECSKNLNFRAFSHDLNNYLSWNPWLDEYQFLPRIAPSGYEILIDILSTRQPRVHLSRSQTDYQSWVDRLLIFKALVWLGIEPQMTSTLHAISGLISVHMTSLYIDCLLSCNPLGERRKSERFECWRLTCVVRRRTIIFNDLFHHGVMGCDGSSLQMSWWIWCFHGKTYW